jgi:hypothetical protein
MTNADNVCWRGKKTKQDWTIAKKSFEKCDNFFWLNIAGHKPKVTIYEDDEEEEKIPVRDLRAKWLEKFK